MKRNIQAQSVNLIKHGVQLLVLIGVIAASPSALAVHAGPIATSVLLLTNTTWAGKDIKYLKTKNPEVRVQTVEFAPGAATIWHKHPVPSYIYVLSGQFVVELADTTSRQFNAGEAFVEVVNTWHRGVNLGTEDAKLLIFYTGEVGTPITIPYTQAADNDKDDKKDKDD